MHNLCDTPTIRGWNRNFTEFFWTQNAILELLNFGFYFGSPIDFGDFFSFCIR